MSTGIYSDSLIGHQVEIFRPGRGLLLTCTEEGLFLPRSFIDSSADRLYGSRVRMKRFRRRNLPRSPHRSLLCTMRVRGTQMARRSNESRESNFGGLILSIDSSIPTGTETSRVQVISLFSKRGPALRGCPKQDVRVGFHVHSIIGIKLDHYLWPVSLLANVVIVLYA